MGCELVSLWRSDIAAVLTDHRVSGARMCAVDRHRGLPVMKPGFVLLRRKARAGARLGTEERTPRMA